MAQQSNSDHNPSLQANYASPTGTHKFNHPLKALPAKFSIKDKTVYLSELRSAVEDLQGEINTLLTTKMEEDKATTVQGNGAIDDQKEEENYGEEVVEEDN
ncbi:hypothetical protein MMC34_002438 [Xylographa carneopallida]|nr:hypothetical protein [Xylographa carneopallida]